MTKKKFNVTVTRTEHYQIEVDTEVWNQEYLKDWSKHFSDVQDHQKLAEVLAQSVSENGPEQKIISGFGTIRKSPRLGGHLLKGMHLLMPYANYKVESEEIQEDGNPTIN